MFFRLLVLGLLEISAQFLLSLLSVRPQEPFWDDSRGSPPSFQGTSCLCSAGRLPPCDQAAWCPPSSHLGGVWGLGRACFSLATWCRRRQPKRLGSKGCISRRRQTLALPAGRSGSPGASSRQEASRHHPVPSRLPGPPSRAPLSQRLPPRAHPGGPPAGAPVPMPWGVVGGVSGRAPTPVCSRGEAGLEEMEM